MGQKTGSRVKIWHNNEFKDEGAPLFPLADRIRLGDGVFDTILAVDGQLIHPQLHFIRIREHAGILGIKLPPAASAEILEETANELLKINDFRTGRYAVNTLVTRGSGARGLLPPDDPNVQVAMRASRVPDEFPPVKAIISETVRRNEGSPLSRIKSINYGDNILALNEARRKGANEAIMLNNAGNVACSTVGNIFVIIGDRILTPPLSDGVMDGITRKLFMEENKVEEKSLKAQELRAADGIYIANSIRGVTAVSTLDDKKFVLQDQP